MLIGVPTPGTAFPYRDFKVLTEDAATGLFYRTKPWDTVGLTQAENEPQLFCKPRVLFLALGESINETV